MSDDPPLFNVMPRGRTRGRVRTGLDADVKAATAADVELSAAGVAALRTLADAIDTLEHHLRLTAKPYDRVPLATLVTTFGDTYDRVFPVARDDADPLTRALAEFAAAETGDPARNGAD